MGKQKYFFPYSEANQSIKSITDVGELSMNKFDQENKLQRINNITMDYNQVSYV